MSRLEIVGKEQVNFIVQLKDLIYPKDLALKIWSDALSTASVLENSTQIAVYRHGGVTK